jgi:hypothetical protein
MVCMVVSLSIYRCDYSQVDVRLCDLCSAVVGEQWCEGVSGSLWWVSDCNIDYVGYGMPVTVPGPPALCLKRPQ